MPRGSVQAVSNLSMSYWEQLTDRSTLPTLAPHFMSMVKNRFMNMTIVIYITWRIYCAGILVVQVSPLDIIRCTKLDL